VAAPKLLWPIFKAIVMMVDTDTVQRVLKRARDALGDWWTDDRRNWCAYCGIKMRLRTTPGLPIPATKFTRDHVVPRQSNAVSLTIPACRACNSAKGTLPLQEFLLTDYFINARKHRHKHQWPIGRLRLVAAAAVLKRSLPLLKMAQEYVPTAADASSASGTLETGSLGVAKEEPGRAR
jgi:hypothetical protein